MLMGVTNLLPLKKCADGDFDAVDAALELKNFDFVGEGFFVSFEHADDVFAVFFFADKEAALDVLRFAAGLDDVAIRILLDEFDGRIERVEIFVGDDVDAGFFQFFLAEGAIVFEIVGVRRAANDGLAGRAQRLRFRALAESVVKDDNVGPLRVFFPVFGFGDKTVRDVAFFFVVDVIADVVAFFEDLPGDIADEAAERGEEKFLFVHERNAPSERRGFHSVNWQPRLRVLQIVHVSVTRDSGDKNYFIWPTAFCAGWCRRPARCWD